jgi:hypothetical protein
MTRIEQILTRARTVLADKLAERWTDDDLLLLLDEGHKDLCQQAKILKARANVPLVFGSPYFSLPEDCWQLTRVTYDNTVIPFVTHTELDNAHGTNSRASRHTFNSSLAYDWQTDTGEPEAVIYDRRNMTEGKVYPIPKLQPIATLFGVAAAVEDGSVIPVFGVTTETSAGDINPFGVLTDYAIAPVLDCYYLQIPATLTEVTDDLVTPAMFDTALKYYVIGNAFLMDIAEEYQAKGLQQLGFYTRDLDLATKSSAGDHQQAAASRTTYRTGF